ncbi:hypothetical protein BZA05DRAFT_452603 [Tricharina praecox]|uniref:uncharacterized protein n=1 Tax=Tricharina praecox TaxID=43433 RepID=UPI00221F437F|nr:uncharacterized protein BZA05DRAFT_452603 [Tricharina praecox]KAI5852362.1 hypothetical protein BZA05DRAFT_452603 [Tricharina praecox]
MSHDTGSSGPMTEAELPIDSFYPTSYVQKIFAILTGGCTRAKQTDRTGGLAGTDHILAEGDALRFFEPSPRMEIHRPTFLISTRAPIRPHPVLSATDTPRATGIATTRTMSRKQSPTSSLTPDARFMRLCCAVLESMVNTPKINYTLLAQKMGYANARVAQDSYCRFRARLRGDANYANRGGGKSKSKSKEKYLAKVRGLGDGEPPKHYDEPVDDDEEEVKGKGKWLVDGEVKVKVKVEKEEEEEVKVKVEQKVEVEERMYWVVKTEPDTEVWVWEGADVSHEHHD